MSQIIIDALESKVQELMNQIKSLEVDILARGKFVEAMCKQLEPLQKENEALKIDCANKTLEINRLQKVVDRLQK